MTEYWVSKKSYICKYCDIFIRDDAPSRAQHESGLKHQGNKERFLRNIYKNGEKAKWAKESERRQMAKIDRAAGIAHSGPLPPVASSSKAAERPKNVWANYSSAASLGFEVEERPLSLVELGHGRGEAGTWETVEVAPEPVEGSVPESENSLKRRRMMAVGDAEREAEAEARDFDYSIKRKIVYDDDDDYDPKALSGLALKVKEKRVIGEPEEPKVDVKKEGGFVKVESAPRGESSEAPPNPAPASEGLKRDGWAGKLSLDVKHGKEANREAVVYEEGGGWVRKDASTAVATSPMVKIERNADEPDYVQSVVAAQATLDATTPTLAPEVKTEDIKPTLAAPAPSMFKKRKGAPAKARAREE